MDFLDEDDFDFGEWLQCCLEQVALPLEHLVMITGLVMQDLEVLGALLMVNFPKIIVKNLIKGCWRQNLIMPSTNVTHIDVGDMSTSTYMTEWE